MAAATGGKAPGAFRTIGELSAELGVAQHILRYWETKFPQLRPLQRAGNRRYYRPADVELARRINRLLNEQGYTVRGVQKLLRDRQAEDSDHADGSGEGGPPVTQPVDDAPESLSRVDVQRLIAVRDRLSAALED